MKLLNFLNWCTKEVSRSTQILLSKSIFYVKNHPKLSYCFSLKNNNLVAHFLLLTLVICSNYLCKLLRTR